MSMPLLDNPFRESRLNTGTDFRPDWDVPDLNRPITDHLAKQVRAVKGRSQPDPGQMIQVLLAPPGYGKTHLFGRVGHELAQEVLFVFVPAFEDVSRPLEHIRWHVVESLFRERVGRSPALHDALARLCRPSFIEYVSQFPPSQAAHHQTLLQGLQGGTESVLAIVQAVKPLAPFQKLAASLASRVQASSSVLRVLGLGWSPLADTARRWLRGESLPDEDLIGLGLRPDDEPPTSLEVLKAVAALLRYETPVVICCDQMEMVLKHPNGPEQVTAPLIEVLSQVPGQVLILSCLHTEWPQFLDKSFVAFRQRVGPPQRLRDLTESQAVELVSRRMQTWEGRQGQHAPTWPFDEASIISYVRDHSQNPRVLIQRCAELFADWAEGDQKGLLYVTRPKDVLDPAKVFLQMWNAELEKVAADPAVAWSEYQEERLYRAVGEVLTLAREAGRELGGVRVRNVAEGALQQRGKIPRRAYAVEVTAGGQDYRVVMPVTTLNNGQNFRYYFEDIELALKGPVEGCLLVHRQTEFQRGGQTRERFDALLEKRLRVFALEDSPATLQRMECLLRFLDRAEGQELQIDSVTLSYKDCQDYVLKTAVLDSLDLLRTLSVWRKATGAPKPAVATPKAAASQPGGAAAATVTAVQTVGSPVLAATVSQAGAGQPAQVTEPTRALAAPPVPAPRVQVAAPSIQDKRQAFTAEQEPWAREKLGVLAAKLKLWGLPVNPLGEEVGPSFARLKIEPAGGKTKFNKIRDRATDLKIQLGLQVAPLIDSQPGYISVDVELPQRRTVTLAEALAEQPAKLAHQPAFPVGVDVAGRAHWLDLSDTSDCHLLVAGQTGSGKSEFLRALVAALAVRLDPGQLQFVLIDPKRVTFNLGKLESPYLHFPVAHDADESLPVLQWCMEETKRRFELLEAQKKTNVGQLEDQSLLPRVVAVVDEFAELLTEKDTRPVLNGLLKQIGAMARAAGIHLVLATQRPDKDVVTPLLKANLPGKIALRVANAANSKLVIGDPSAVCLLGKGDLLWQRGGGLQRLQSPFATQAELEKALRAH